MLKTIAKLISVVVVVLILAACFLIYMYVKIPGGVEKEIVAENYNGVINSINEVQSCFIEIHVKQNAEINSLVANSCCHDGEEKFFSYIQVGDSLIKKKGELTITIIKSAIHKSASFQYPYCFR